VHRPALAGVQVLVVEDDAPSAKLAFVLLTDAGCRVRVARTAEEAIALLDAFTPQIVVLDLILPRTSGLVLVEMLKADARTRESVVVAVTSFHGPEAERLALDAGCAGFIRKPIDTESFAATLAALLDASRKGSL